jgi:Isochorismatase family
MQNIAALRQAKVNDAVFMYVDYVTGLDNLITTIPGNQFRNNVSAFAKMSDLFKAPTIVFGEENEYYGTFLPEIRALIDAGAARFSRTSPTGYIPEVKDWLKNTGRKQVVIGGISIDNCTLHTALDLLRDGYEVFVVVDVSGTNGKLAEDVALRRLADAGAVLVGWLSILTELGMDFAGPFGEGMMGIIQNHWPASTVGELSDTTPDGHGMQPVLREVA